MDFNGLLASVKKKLFDNEGVFQRGQFTPFKPVQDNLVQRAQPMLQQAKYNFTGNINNARKFGWQNIQQVANPNTADSFNSRLNRPNTTLPDAQKYLINRYAAPVLQTPYRATQFAGGVKDLITKPSWKAAGNVGMGALGTLGGLATLSIDPIQDVAMPAYDALKGYNASAVRGGGMKDRFNTARQSLTLEKPVGLGTALSKDPTKEMVGNLAEMPLVLGLAHKANKKMMNGWNKDQIEMVQKGFSPEVRQLVGRFSEIVEKNPTTANRKNLGELGDYIQSLATTVFGKEAENLSNKQLKNAFDSIMQSADRYGRGIKEPFTIGLNATDTRRNLEATINSKELVNNLKDDTPIANISKLVSNPKDTPEKVYLKSEVFQNILKKHPDKRNVEFNKEMGFIRTLELPDRINELTDKQRINFIKKLTDKYEGFINKVVVKPIPKDGKTYMNTSYITNHPWEKKKFLSEGQPVPSSPVGVGGYMPTSAKTKNIIPFSKEDLQQILEEVKREFPNSTSKDIIQGPVQYKKPNQDLVNVMVSTKKKDATYVGSRLRNGTDPFLQGLEQGAQQNEKKVNLPTDDIAQYKASLKGGGFDKISPDAKVDFAKWVNSRRASDTEGVLQGRKFEKYDPQGVEGILKSQAPETKKQYSDVRDYFDKKYALLQNEGIKFNYKQEYLPQLWANKEEEVRKVFGNRLNTKPSFTFDSMIKDYQEGLDKGLTPRYNSISELVRWYESKANKALSDKKYFNALAGEGLIQPSGKAPIEWKSLDADRFPRLRVNIDGQKEYQGVYKAPAELADMINNYLYNPAEGSTSSRLFNSIANFTSSSKNRMLSFGVPQTGINAHGFNILARNILSAKNPIEGAITGLKYMVNPNTAIQDLDRNLAKAPFAIKNGLTLSTSEYKSSLDMPQDFKGKFGEKWNQWFEKGLFDRMIPALKLKKFYEVYDGYSKSMPKEEAAREAANFTNNVFGGINWEAMGKSRDMQNLKRALILAPDWMETNINLGKEIGKSLIHPKSPAGQAYRRFATTLLGSYVTMNVINQLSSGHPMFMNDPGHEFEIEAGYTNDGEKRYIRPFNTAVDFIRLPHDAILSLAKGDLSAPFRMIRNRLSTPLSGIVGLGTDTNYKGQTVGVKGRDKYGNEIPLQQRIGGISNEVGSIAGFPAFGSNIIDFATGKQGPEQSITQGFELPFRFSGGSNSNVQKQAKGAIPNMSGKDLYDLNKQLKGERKFSDNQLNLIKSGGKGQLDQILKDRESKAQDNVAIDKMKAGTENVMRSGSKIYIRKDNGDIRAIDLSKNIKAPELTGNTQLDKKLISRYSSEITQQENNIVDLYNAGQINKQEAETALTKLKSLKTKYGGSKKPKLKKAKFTISKRKVKPIKLASVKIKKTKTKPIKVKQRKFKITPYRRSKIKFD